MLILVAIVAAVVAFAAGYVLSSRQRTADVVFVQREKQVTIDFLDRELVGARERIRQLEHTLDEARTAALNLTPPVLRDAALAGTATDARGYDEALSRELAAIDNPEHLEEYKDTIRQMRLENPAISDKEIRLTLFP